MGLELDSQLGHFALRSGILALLIIWKTGVIALPHSAFQRIRRAGGVWEGHVSMAEGHATLGWVVLQWSQHLMA